MTQTHLNSNTSFVNSHSSPTRTIAVTSGKGGVGKTSIALNCAIALSRTGNKVCVLDADTSLANVNIMLGIYPEYTVEHVLSGEKDFSDIVISGPGGIDIIPGASGFTNTIELDELGQAKFLEGLCHLEKAYDYFIIDTAAGIASNVLHYIGAAQVALLVITPEPTSLTDAFSLLKVLKRRGYKRPVSVVVNMSPSINESKRIYARFEVAVKKYLAMECRHLTSIWRDETVRESVLRQRPVALLPRHDTSTRCFFSLAENVQQLFSQSNFVRFSFASYWKKVVERQSNEIKKPADSAENKASTDASAGNNVPAGNIQTTQKWSDFKQLLPRFLSDPEQAKRYLEDIIQVCSESSTGISSDFSLQLMSFLAKQLDVNSLTTSQLEASANYLDQMSKEVRYQLSSFENLRSRPVLQDEESVVVIHAHKPAGSRQSPYSRVAENANEHIESMLNSIKYASQVDTE